MDERGCVAGGRDSFDPTDLRVGGAQALVSLLYAHVLAVRDIQSLSVTLFLNTLIFVTFWRII